MITGDKERDRRSLLDRCDGLVDDALGLALEPKRNPREAELDRWRAFAVSRHVDRLRKELEHL